jgi:hypothetical protein
VFFHCTSRSTRPIRSRGSHGRLSFVWLGCCNRIRSFLTASHDTGALGRQCSSELVSLFAAPWPRAHNARKRGLPDLCSVTPHCFKSCLVYQLTIPRQQLCATVLPHKSFRVPWHHGVQNFIESKTHRFCSDGLVRKTSIV